MHESIKKAYPDWDSLKPGEWSEYGYLQYGKDILKSIEIGLYREPIKGGERDGLYTLQLFNADQPIDSYFIDELKDNDIDKLFNAK